MIQTSNRINSKQITTNEGLYATISKARITAVASTEIIQGNAEKEGIRQACQTVHAEPRVAEDKEAKRQA